MPPARCWPARRATRPREPDRHLPWIRCAAVVNRGAMKRVLNVGGNSRAIALPAPYHDYQVVLLDIDPAGEPDIVCDARELATLEPGTFDAVYCSHNLEHYHEHEVPRVLHGFHHVLRDGGFVHIRVPDIGAVMQAVVQRGLDIEDTLYASPAGPIRVLDVVYGYSPEIERSGNPFYAHRTGFTRRSLHRVLVQARFAPVHIGTAPLEAVAVAFKGASDPEVEARFGLRRAAAA